MQGINHHPTMAAANNNNNNNSPPANPFRPLLSVPREPEVVREGEDGHQALQLSEQTFEETVRNMVDRDIIAPNPVFVKIGHPHFADPHQFKIVLSLGNDRATSYRLVNFDEHLDIVGSEEWGLAHKVEQVTQREPEITGAWIHSEECGCAGFVIGPIYPAVGNDDQENLRDTIFSEFQSYRISSRVFQITADKVKPCFQEGQFPFHPWPQLREKPFDAVRGTPTVTTGIFVSAPHVNSGTAFGNRIGLVGDATPEQWWLQMMSARIVTGDGALLANLCGIKKEIYNDLGKYNRLISAKTPNGVYFTFADHIRSDYPDIESENKVEIHVFVDDANDEYVAEARSGATSWCSYVAQAVDYAHEAEMVELNCDDKEDDE